MQICLVGDFSSNLDEGYKNTSHYLADHLAAQNTVVRMNAKQVGTTQFWRRYAATRPQIIHTIAQPTNQSLVLTRMLRLLHPRARTVVSALKAESYFAGGRIAPAQRRWVRAARPDLVLVQTDLGETLFRELGCRVRRLPNGVALERFHPAPPARKRELRAAYGLDPARPVVLSVGHLEAVRNLTALAPLPAAGIQVLIAGSLYMGTNLALIAELEDLGFHVLKGYQPHIEELYMLADCYVFPVHPGHSLTMPLSVLEAMACNLPVLTARFSGLEQAFAEGPSFQFLRPEGDILDQVRPLLAVGDAATTREMVRAYSWPAVVEELQTYYRGLLN